jgi:hypothetical protein
MSMFFQHALAALLSGAVVLCSGISNAQSVNGTDTAAIEQNVIALEKACVLSLRSLNVAQGTYRGGDDSKGFARTFKQLGPAGEGLLDAATVSGKKDGYHFRMIPEAVGQTGAIKHYKILAQPATRIGKHQRSYYTDETGVIRWTELAREPAVTDAPLAPPYDR